jgi:hypothetical protein
LSPGGETVVAGLGRTERDFSERDRDVLDLVRPLVEDALRDSQARERLGHARETSPPAGTAVVLLDRHGEIEESSFDAERWERALRAGGARRLATGGRWRMARPGRAHRSSACETGDA